MLVPELGYRRRARPVLGMLTKDLLEYAAEQWLGAVDAASAHGCDLVCFCGGALQSPGAAPRSNAIYDVVSGEALDGLIVWTSVLAIDAGPERMAEFGRRFAALPMVTVEQRLGAAPVVLMENRQGMCTAVSHLIEVHGRRRIGFVRGPANHAGAQERYAGYRDALATHGLVEDPALVSAQPSSWLPEVAADLVGRMLRLDVPPDGIATANDDFAVAALSALAASGVRTPEDVPVVGFDDVTNVRTHDLGFDSADDDASGAVRRAVNISASALALTTVRAPFHEMGRRAVDSLVALLRGEPVPDVVTVPTQLVVRRSCGCLPSRPVQSSAIGPPDELTAAFMAEVRGQAPGQFLRLLDRYTQASLRSKEGVEDWYRVLFTLRRLVGPAAGAAEVTRAEDLWLRAQLLVNETAERDRRYRQVLAEKRNQIVREVGQRLITAPDLTALARTLAAELPKVGIPGCYLASYEAVPADGAEPPTAPAAQVSTARSRLLLAYEDGAPAEVDGDAAVFTSGQLVPGGRLHRAAPYSMVAEPLYFNDQQLGFALFELGPRIGWIYAALREQLSSALHRAFLIERERLAVAAVAEAHRREERHRLAGELHDSVSQALFSMTLHTRAVQLAVQQQGLDPGGRIARGLADLRELTQGALTEMRALIFQLRPAALHEEGLAVAVRRHAAAVAAREGFDVRVHAPDDRLPLDERVEEELFRVVQEALHNSVKHARPGRVDIRLEALDGPAGGLVVEVADDGVGFDPAVRRPGHLGLDSMRERAQRVGGRFTVHTAPGRPTTVRVVLPAVPPAAGGGSDGPGR